MDVLKIEGGAEVSAADVENIDAILGELEIEAQAEEPAVEEPIEELTAEDEAVVESAVAAAEVYEEQNVSATEIAADPAAPAPAAAKKDRTPRAPRDLNAIDDAVFQLTDGESADKAAVIAAQPSQKKIAEKFVNLFQALSAGKAPSVYVMACFRVLDEKGSVTQGDLVAALQSVSSGKGTGYSIGTARSQAGQVMELFNVARIANRDKQTLTLRSDSVVARRLRAMASAPAAA